MMRANKDFYGHPTETASVEYQKCLLAAELIACYLLVIGQHSLTFYGLSKVSPNPGDVELRPWDEITIICITGNLKLASETRRF